MSIANDIGFTAVLHISAQGGHVTVTKMLIEAGADLEAAHPTGITALHAAAGTEYWEVVRAPVMAGANVDSRTVDRDTPLHAAELGHAQATMGAASRQSGPIVDQNRRRPYLGSVGRRDM